MMVVRVDDEFLRYGRVYRIVGLSPMSTTPRRLRLEDIETGERTNADLDETRREALIRPARPTHAR